MAAESGGEAMTEVASATWIYVVIAILIAFLVAWWALVATRRTRIQRSETRPSEDTPARRNQALIDAAGDGAVVDVPPATPEGLAGVGTAVAAAAEPIHQPPAAPTDDLRQIKGVGPKLAALLNSLGVTRYAQIAAWDDAEIDRIDAQLGAFQGRIRRDDWPAQARLLAAGDRAGFENRFGTL
jgi:predicted flap endonuclease-1-like 5' DNA nuclease